MILTSPELSITEILFLTFLEVDLQFPNEIIQIAYASSHEFQAELYTLSSSLSEMFYQ